SGGSSPGGEPRPGTGRPGPFDLPDPGALIVMDLVPERPGAIQRQAEGRWTSSQAGDDRDHTRCDLSVDRVCVRAAGGWTSSQASDARLHPWCDLSVDRVCVRAAETGAIWSAVRRDEFRWQT